MKEKILDTCIQLFGQKGYKETSIQDIVEAIGVTKGTFYYYYKSKQEILADICMDYIDRLIEEQNSILRNPNLDCSEKLHKMVYMLITSIKKQRSRARIFFRDMRNLEESQFEQIKVKRRLFRENYQTLIDEGIHKGLFKEGLNADMLTFGILGMTNWTYYWYNPDGEISESELSDIYIDLILHGLLKEKQ